MNPRPSVDTVYTTTEKMDNWTDPSTPPHHGEDGQLDGHHNRRRRWTTGRTIHIYTITNNLHHDRTQTHGQITTGHKPTFATFGFLRGEPQTFCGHRLHHNGEDGQLDGPIHTTTPRRRWTTGRTPQRRRTTTEKMDNWTDPSTPPHHGEDGQLDGHHNGGEDGQLDGPSISTP